MLLKNYNAMNGKIVPYRYSQSGKAKASGAPSPTDAQSHEPKAE
jgi:hypothetical protein